MSLQSDYQDFLQRHEKQMSGPLAKYWKNQEARYVHPFRIFGNVWYVGDDWVCVHLIDTGDGLLLIDCGNTGATAMLVNAIWEAGFNPADVKWLVLSHGHLDHIGGAAFFRNMFGTKIYLGAPDAKMYREHPELSFIQDAGNVSEALVMPDVEINDGDVIRFGNTDVRFYLSPGHTMGVISCFFDAHEGEKTVRCGYYGGFGFNTLQKDYLIEIGDPEYIQFLVEPTAMIVGIAPAPPRSMSAVKISRRRLESDESIEIYSQTLVLKLYDLAGLNIDEAYRVSGRFLAAQNILAFYLRTSRKIVQPGGTYEKEFLQAEG